MTLITSVFWVSLSTYRAFTVKPAESVPEEISNPIILTLDQTAIKAVESRIYLDSSLIPLQVATKTSTPSPVVLKSPSPTPTSLETLIPNPSPTPLLTP